MPVAVHVHLLPALTDEAELADTTVVVIDVIRATTTIVHALVAGAASVIPCLEVDEVRRVAADLDQLHTVLGGERGGQRIEGFDLANSPAEYIPSSVAGKTVVFTTSNGTRAMQLCRRATRVMTGAFVNLSAVEAALDGADEVHLLCAGTSGQVSREDTLLAGALADRLLAAGAVAGNDEARVAADAWRHVAADPAPDALLVALRDGHGGENMRAIGQENDLDLVARIDRFDIVPTLDVPSWRITAAGPPERTDREATT